MKNKKIVVIGASGLVGLNFIKKFNRDNEILELHTANSHNLLQKIKEDKDFKCDCVVFCAQARNYKTEIFNQMLFETNLSLLHDSLNIFINKTNKFIYFSSGSVYDNLLDKVINESTPLNYNSTNPYVISKISAELITRTFIKQYKNLYILRPFYIYGKEQHTDMLFKQLIKKIKTNENIYLNDDGGMYFNPIYVEDVVNILNILIKKDEGFKIFNICSKDYIKLEDVVNEFSQLLNIKSNIIYVKQPLKKFIAKSKYQLLDKYVRFKEVAQEIIDE